MDGARLEGRGLCGRDRAGVGGSQLKGGWCSGSLGGQEKQQCTEVPSTAPGDLQAWPCWQENLPGKRGWRLDAKQQRNSQSSLPREC